MRVLVGVLFIGHATQKLFDGFGGFGLAGTGAFMESLGLRSGRGMALLAGLSEATGGVLLVVGVWLPLAAVLIGGAMLVAIAKVHGKNGLWSQNIATSIIWSCLLLLLWRYWDPVSLD